MLITWTVFVFGVLVGGVVVWERWKMINSLFETWVLWCEVKMFRSSKWRSEKNRIKVVFKLQFNATKVWSSQNFYFLIILISIAYFIKHWNFWFCEVLRILIIFYDQIWCDSIKNLFNFIFWILSMTCQLNAKSLTWRSLKDSCKIVISVTVINNFYFPDFFPLDFNYNIKWKK